jgi:MFS family permease
VDDSSYPGLYSLLSDYFGPGMRGKVYGLLQLSQPLGYMLGLLVATFIAVDLGWRGVFYITGTLGLVIAVVIYFGVKEPPRGMGEPELAGLEDMGVYRFDRKHALDLFKKKSLLLLFAQGFVGGLLGDYAFKKTPRGRVLVSMVGVFMGAVLLLITMNVPTSDQTRFLLFLMATALFIPFAFPNVISTVHDITLPEVRSTALSIQYFIENAGAALAPLLAGLIAVQASLHSAILIISISAWALGAVLLGVTAYLVPEDIHDLHQELEERAEFERARQASPVS